MDICRLSTGACLIFSGSSRSSALLPPGESAADGVGQNLRKVAASIPGMGPPDVAYPESMLGRWRVRRSLADVTFPNGEAAAETDVAQMLGRKGTVDSFTVRFIQGKGGVVSDRDFNTRALTRASEGADVAVQWKSSNPNVLTVSYPSGMLRETKVRGPVGCGTSGLPFPTFFCFFSLLDKHEKRLWLNYLFFFGNWNERLTEGEKQRERLLSFSHTLSLSLAFSLSIYLSHSTLPTQNFNATDNPLLRNCERLPILNPYYLLNLICIFLRLCMLQNLTGDETSDRTRHTGAGR